jgi:hypothetical protein
MDRTGILKRLRHTFQRSWYQATISGDIARAVAQEQRSDIGVVHVALDRLIRHLSVVHVRHSGRTHVTTGPH